MPGVPNVAVFDTTFGMAMEEKAYLYAIPHEYFEKYSIRRYGFHGTSHMFVSGEAIKFAADAEERFLSAVEANKSFKDDRTLCEKHQQMEVIPVAQCACAQQELIAHLFGVSDERIHEDLARVILSR